MLLGHTFSSKKGSHICYHNVTACWEPEGKTKPPARLPEHYDSGCKVDNVSHHHAAETANSHSKFLPKNSSLQIAVALNTADRLPLRPITDQVTANNMQTEKVITRSSPFWTTDGTGHTLLLLTRACFTFYTAVCCVGITTIPCSYCYPLPRFLVKSFMAASTGQSVPPSVTYLAAVKPRKCPAKNKLDFLSPDIYTEAYQHMAVRSVRGTGDGLSLFGIRNVLRAQLLPCFKGRQNNISYTRIETICSWKRKGRLTRD